MVFRVLGLLRVPLFRVLGFDLGFVFRVLGFDLGFHHLGCEGLKMS